MAREYAKIRTDIWGDEDWRGVSASAKLLYLMLLSHATLTYAGVADWRPNRLAPLLDREWTRGDVERHAAELESNHLIVTNEETEEVLVRSFIKHDGVMKQPRLAVAMAAAFAGISCTKIKSVVAFEVKKLRDEMPELACWKDARVQTVLDHSGFDLKSLGNGLPSVSAEFGPNVGEELVSPTNTKTKTSSKEDRGASRKQPEKPLPDGWEPSKSHAAYASAHQIDLDHEVFQFKAHAEANDRRQRNWNGAFTQWLGNAKKWSRPKEQQPSNAWMARTEVPAWKRE